MGNGNIDDSEKELLQECRSGKEEAFDRIVLMYEKRLFNLAYRMVGNYEDAKDIVQESFVKAYRGLPGFRGECKLYTWLYGICGNLCKNKLREMESRKRTESLDDPVLTEEGEVQRQPPDKNPSAFEVVRSKEIEEIVQSAILKLDEDDRMMIILRDIQGIPYEEISRTVGIEMGTVKSRIHRARMALKELLKDVIK